MVLIGVTSQGRIGIDVETIRMVPELDDIVIRHFSSEERDSIQSADGQTKTRLFFTRGLDERRLSKLEAWILLRPSQT